ncbi:MAG TPA: isochorismatase family cysteine hydrolase [Candidatus Angelobacter sp.]|nr:isochorismatase family cysteine hydrolase [Candidatus Angelobacter sp.]
MLPPENGGQRESVGGGSQAIPVSQRRGAEKNYSKPGCAAGNPIEGRIQDFMQALIVVDAQNEFSPEGLRAVPGHAGYLERIHRRVQEAREEKQPIAWVRHYNRPNESRAFVPKTWGSELSPGLGPQDGFGPEKLFEKDVFGAFSGTSLEEWLRSLGVSEVLLAGFFTHMCVSTSAREALVRGFEVKIDADATGAHDVKHPVLGQLTAAEVKKSALLHLSDMGVRIEQAAAHQAESPGKKRVATINA